MEEYLIVDHCLNLRSIGIELDTNLTELQNNLCKKTNIKFEIVNDDASTFDFAKLHLSKPIFFVSGLPEMGEMFVDNLIQTTIQNNLLIIWHCIFGKYIQKKICKVIVHFMGGEKL